MPPLTGAPQPGGSGPKNQAATPRARPGHGNACLQCTQPLERPVAAPRAKVLVRSVPFRREYNSFPPSRNPGFIVMREPIPLATYEDLCPFGGHAFRSDEATHGICAVSGRPLREALLVPEEGEFLALFERTVGKPRGLQRVWVRRIMRGESFTAVAATGIGKTTLGAFAALYLAQRHRKRCYILVPGGLLVRQVAKRLLEWSQSLGWRVGLNPRPRSKGVRIAAYHAWLTSAEKRAFAELLASKAWHVLVTTPQLLTRRFDELSAATVDFCFADDVDALLKSSRNTDRLLALLGYTGRRRRKGQLMASSATARPGRGAMRLRDVLGLDVGSTAYSIRRIIDVLETEPLDRHRLTSVASQLGPGGLIYCTSQAASREVTEWLRESGRAAHVDEKNALERFEKGECDFLVGVSSYYGKLVRGLDLPFRVRYALFQGVPAFRIHVRDLDAVSAKLLRLLAFLYRNEPELNKFRQRLRRLTLPGEEDLRSEVRMALKALLSEGRQPAGGDVVVRAGELIIPDLRTYVQASGRTSRLTAGGLTKGLSIVFEPDPALAEAFRKRAELYDISFSPMEKLDLASLSEELTRDREEKARQLQEGVDVLEPVLMVVESPTKARQIARFFGRPAVKRYTTGGQLSAIAYEVPAGNMILTVAASLGHVTDLVPEGGIYGVDVNGVITPRFAAIKRCLACNTQFTDPDRQECPNCGSRNVDSSANRLAVLRVLASDSHRMFIGTDPDTEGERIAWDLSNLVGVFASKVERAEFHEVTRRAVERALSEPRQIDNNLVMAQFVRRIEDRWIGFSLSELLWRAFGKHWLSAGRAQTAVLGWLVERTRLARQRKSVGYIRDWRLEIEDFDQPQAHVRVELLERKTETRNPLPPYTTDTLLTDATRALRAPADEIMRLAQHLFESGLITYHRTDSTHVSEAGRAIARQVLGDLAVPRAWSDEGAHEAIRPTRPLTADDIRRLIYEGELPLQGITGRHLRLYDLIWRRFLASQAPPYEVTLERYRVIIDGARELQVERIVEARGPALDLYPFAARQMPPLPSGSHVLPVEVRRVPLAPLFTEAEVIAMMRQRGIGRPSTYATILARLKQRRYVIERKSKLIATSLGMHVYDYLKARFPGMISESRTRELEQKMLAVERGEADPDSLLRAVLAEIREVQSTPVGVPANDEREA